MNRCARVVHALLASVLASMVPVSAPGAAERGAAGNEVSRSVVYGDLDLTTDSGRRQLDRRLKRAAWHVCQETSPMREAGAIGHGMCIRRVSRAAQAQVFAGRSRTGPLVVGRDPR